MKAPFPPKKAAPAKQAPAKGNPFAKKPVAQVKGGMPPPFPPKKK